jgi:hypothetical protein
MAAAAAASLCAQLRVLNAPHFVLLQVCNAITRQKKEAIVTEVAGKLESSVIVFGLRFKGLDVRGFGGSAGVERLTCPTCIRWDPAWPPNRRGGAAIASVHSLLPLLLLLLSPHTQVPTMQRFRKGIPEKSSVYICKNSLMREAVKAVPGWDTIGAEGCSVSVGVWQRRQAGFAGFCCACSAAGAQLAAGSRAGS